MRISVDRLELGVGAAHERAGAGAFARALAGELERGAAAAPPSAPGVVEIGRLSVDLPPGAAAQAELGRAVARQVLERLPWAAWEE
ncbi:MAG TPA: hypothetical protein VEW03_03870 [Longimicrobiaceae bacterium]|nr:hypothetical protein [Longimicrobiaceae bacterium]